MNKTMSRFYNFFDHHTLPQRTDSNRGLVVCKPIEQATIAITTLLLENHHDEI